MICNRRQFAARCRFLVNGSWHGFLPRRYRCLIVRVRQSFVICHKFICLRMKCFTPECLLSHFLKTLVFIRYPDRGREGLFVCDDFRRKRCDGGSSDVCVSIARLGRSYRSVITRILDMAGPHRLSVWAERSIWLATVVRDGVLCVVVLLRLGTTAV